MNAAGVPLDTNLFISSQIRQYKIFPHPVN